MGDWSGSAVQGQTLANAGRARIGEEARPARAEQVRITVDGGEVARLVRGRVPAEVALAELRRSFVASQLPPRSPLGSPG